MTGSKKFYQSKGVMGGLVAVAGAGNGIAPILAIALGSMGYQVTGADAAEILQGVEQIITAGAGLIAVWGRVSASARVER
ncbi:hypothetical protein FIU97_14550 [Roseivivax sp. THAF40]|uniref:hypothetical protein n=1 Tax=Roseivivax sp. THAF40 TaxID=2587858 RepID=UPI001269860A|nr:hypothetical protein [Roseivivax sp. THAF40]QFT47799.1 hypothetical protein FIU97_14550 [Roseivivax sp. THAF40]